METNPPAPPAHSDPNAAALAALDRGLSRIEPAVWITHRKRTLRSEALLMSSGINLSKGLSLGSGAAAVFVSLAFGATGVGVIAGGTSLAAYLASVLADKLDTGRFAPLPFLRTRLGDRLTTLGNADARELRAQWEEAQQLAGKSTFDADEELYSNLPMELCQEAMMLSKHGYLIGQLLSRVPAAKRDLAYLNLCSSYQTFGDALTGMSLERLMDQVEGRVGGDYFTMQPAELQPYQAPVYQVGDRAFGALPEPAGNFGALPAVGEPSDSIHQSIGNAAEVAQSALDILVNNAAISRAIYGGQRTGKSYLCAVASRQRHQAKGTKTFFVNLNAFDQEDGYYWQHSEDSVVVNVHSMNKERAKVAVQSAIDVVSRFQTTPNSLLIVDEWSSCGAKTMGHQALLEEFTQAVASVNNAISPTAIKRKQAIWLLTPAIVATEMTQAAKTIKSMQPLIVAISPGHDVFYDGARLTFDSILYQQVAQNYNGQIADVPPSFDEPRMVQVDKAWVAVGVTGHELDQAKASPRPQQALSEPHPLTERSSWQRFRQGIATEYPGMPELMDWMATRADPCDDRDVTRVTAVREAIKKNGADKPVSEVIRDYLSTLVTANLVAQNGDSYLGLPHA